jgi:hypothetical protein
MTLRFELETEPTLDGSYPIIVRCMGAEGMEEYAFQFACNIVELKDLLAEVKKGIADYRKEEKRRWRMHHRRKMSRIKNALRRVK